MAAVYPDNLLVEVREQPDGTKWYRPGEGDTRNLLIRFVPDDTPNQTAPPR
jgi:hypothetical protein